jgi:hypothetical protein
MHLWTSIVFFLSSLARGTLSFCNRCGKLTECYAYSHNIRLHRNAGTRYGYPSTPPPPIPEKYASMRVCIMCDLELDEELDMHNGCWCRSAAARANHDAS